MSVSLIKNHKLIEETNRTDDLLGFDNELKKLENKLSRLSGACMMGFVGRYGIGKSVLLHQIERKIKDAKWINFDAWKYHDKKDLWEGFVLDLAEQVSDKNQKSTLEKIEGRKSVSGEVGKDVMKIVTDVLLGPIANKFLSSFLDPLYTAYPATRVFEIQKILMDLIETHIQEKEIYIVVEDVDRSGKYGIYFLETLKQFLNQLRENSKKKVVVIVPIADESYKNFNHSYLKSLDDVEFFRPKPNFKNFLESVINPEINKPRKIAVGSLLPELVDRPQQMKQITSFFEVLFQDYSMTPRMLKNILRLANHSYIRQQEFGHNPDWRLTICIEATKHFYTEYRNSVGSVTGEKDSFFDKIARDNRIDPNEHRPFFAMIHCVSSSSWEADKIKNFSTKTGAEEWYQNINLRGHATFVDKLSEEHFNKKDVHTIISSKREYIEIPKFYLDY